MASSPHAGSLQDLSDTIEAALSWLDEPVRVTDSLPEYVRPQGEIKHAPDDFRVHERPLYEPGGEGEHAYLWVVSEDASHGWMMGQIARELGVERRSLGYAGAKDRHARTAQWISAPARELDASIWEPSSWPLQLNEQIAIERVVRHSNKLRMGHLRGNDFEIMVRTRGEAEALDASLSRGVEALTQHGAPNYYGTQRFGIDRETLALGYGLVIGDDTARAKVRSDRYLKRLSVNALQSALFNEVLASRIADGSWKKVLSGDVLSKPNGASFLVESVDDVRDAQRRVDEGEIAISGPMFGPKMLSAGGEVAEREHAVLARTGLDVRQIGSLGKIALGARRPFAQRHEGLAYTLEPELGVRVRFFLPSGAYATVLLKELFTLAASAHVAAT